jgi:uncharacterized protein YecE (DUF72 family)
MRAENIEVGTSGWHFEDWAGVFYPLRVKKDHWLEYYSSRFNVGELNSSYYRLPSSATVDAIQHRTPVHFKLFVKLHGDVTHVRKDPATSVKALLNTIEPLQSSGKLLGLLAQFPASFKHSAENEKYLLLLKSLTESSRLCVEFRDCSWDNDSVRRMMRSEQMTWVCPDEPELPYLIKPEIHVTSDILYVRLHGRNRKTWYDTAAGDRYDYSYSESELEEWGKTTLNFKQELPGGYLFFNNCHLGQAVKNATWLFYWIKERRNQDDKETGANDFTLSSH